MLYSSRKYKTKSKFKKPLNANKKSKNRLYDGKISLQKNYENGNSIEYLSQKSNESIYDVSNERKSCNYLSLEAWNLPHSILEGYKRFGILHLFEWQAECLLKGNVLRGGNLIYTAPTSSGKTLVAEILILKKILENNKKALYILPFISVAREKMEYLQNAGIRVDGFMGTHYPPGGFNSLDIAICTIEKANNLINKLFEEKNLYEIGIIVLDELHLMSDPQRGYLLELLLTKILYTNKNSKSFLRFSPIQIIGMSASLSNLNNLTVWLHADYYQTEFRPVLLKQHILVNSFIYDKDMNIVRELPAFPELMSDSNHLTLLCLETVSEGHGVLIFCPTKQWCENVSVNLAKDFQKLKNLSIIVQKLLSIFEACISVLDDLKSCPVGLDKILAQTVNSGICYHHAGLTFEERQIIEKAFFEGKIRIVVATSTLSSGVNLPARRVIIRSPFFHGSPLDPVIYQQMAGRSGRKGIDTEGECILICKTKDIKIAQKLISSVIPNLESCLYKKKSFSSGLERALLEALVNNIASTSEDICSYINSTFLFANNSLNDSKEISSQIINFLLKNEIIEELYDSTTNIIKYQPSRLGFASVASGLPPDQGVQIFNELSRARSMLCLDNDLHLLYQITPTHVINVWGEINWINYLDIWENLDDSGKKIGNLIGIEEKFIIKALKGSVHNRNSKQKMQLFVHKRFYVALALFDLICEIPLIEVAYKYGCPKGLLQSLQQSASTFAGMLTVFCSRLGWSNMELLLEQFQSRLYFGVQRELCDLLRLNTISSTIARILFDAGIKNIVELSHCYSTGVHTILRNNLPFHRENCSLLICGKNIKISSLAEILINEARSLLQEEIGIKMIWGSDKSNLSNTSQVGSYISGGIIQNEILAKELKYGKNEKDMFGSEDEIESNINEKQVERNFQQLEKLNSDSYFVPSSFSTTKKNLTKIELVQSDFDFMKKKESSLNEYDKPNLECQNDSIDTFCKTDMDMFSSSQNYLVHQEKKFQKINMLISANKYLKCPQMFNSNISHKHNKSMTSNLKQNDFLSKDENLTSPSKIPKLEFVPNLLKSSRKLQFSLNIKTNDINKNENKINAINLSLELEEKCCIPSSQISVSKNANDIKQFEHQPFIFSMDVNPSKLDLINKTPDSTSLQHKFTPELKSTFRADTLSAKLENKSSNKKVKVMKIDTEFKFQNFYKKHKDCKNFSVCLACKQVANKKFIGIDKNLLYRKQKFISGIQNKCNLNVIDEVISGLAIFAGGCNIYYIPATASNGDLIKKALSQIYLFASLISFDVKQLCKLLLDLIGTSVYNIKFEDITVADWILDCTSRSKNMSHLVLKYCPELTEHLIKLEPIGHLFSVSLDMCHPQPANVRATTEAYIAFFVMKTLREKLTDVDLLKLFLDVEMPTFLFLSLSEIWGIAINVEYLNEMQEILTNKLKYLENKAYESAGRKFSLVSPAAIQKILFTELQLPFDSHLLFPNEYDEDEDENQYIYMLPFRKQKSYKNMSTKKEILYCLQNSHPLPKIIVAWRKVNWALNQRIRQSEERNIQSCYFNFTLTGRATMQSPNLQSVPKDFFIEENCINLRSIFISNQGSVFLSADYKHLELRILAHLSKDQKLHKCLEEDDIFQKMADIWKTNIPLLDNHQARQQAKQVCYAILYGINSKSLSYQLQIDENTAYTLLEEFRQSFPDVQHYLTKVVNYCENQGFITTLLGRKRYLPHINSKNSKLKAQAERQAINGTIQGSAADLFKMAFCKTEKSIQNLGYLAKVENDQIIKGARLVLQLHDELIYEVACCDLDDLVSIIKSSMESAFKLSVKLPVQIKIGCTWGNLI